MLKEFHGFVINTYIRYLSFITRFRVVLYDTSL